MVVECFRNFLLLFNQLTLVHNGSGSRGTLIFVLDFVNRFPHLLGLLEFSSIKLR